MLELLSSLKIFGPTLPRLDACALTLFFFFFFNSRLNRARIAAGPVFQAMTIILL